MKLSNVNKVAETKEIKVPFGDDELTITYSRSDYTPKFERELNQKMKDGLPSVMLSEMLLKVVHSWDVIDDNGNPVPLTREVIEENFSITAITKIAEAIGESERPNPTKSPKPNDSF